MRHSVPSDLPIARLDPQDLEQALPIREYLEQNGVAVVVGRKPAIREAYHIVCGEPDFVKDTIEQTGKISGKLFIVLFLSNRHTIPEKLSETHAKIAAVSGKTLSARDVPAIFAHFFTGDEPVLSLDTKTQPMVEIRPVEEKPERKRPVGKKPRKKYLMVLPALFVVPVVWYVVSLVMIAAVQWYALSAANRGDVSKFSTAAPLTRYWAEQGRATLALIGIPVRHLGGAPVVRNQERILSIATDVANAQDQGAALVRESGRLAASLFGHAEPSEAPAIVLDRTRLALERVADSLGLIVAQLRTIQAGRGQPPVDRLAGKINQLLTSIGNVRSLLALYRAAGGFDEKKTYLLLFQNSMELRPTGGFIGSVAIVTMENGVIAPPVVQDVYALDGQLKGHVDPPVPIREVLQQEHWYLRDSNWDPDFAVSGEKAAWFYEKETGQTVDGVIGITTNFLSGLLDVTGPVDLPDYNDRITKDNFFGKSLFYTKADFFPGSTQKKDFLGSLTTALLAAFTRLSANDAAPMVRVLVRSLTAGEIQVWFADPVAQSIARQALWSGELDTPVACALGEDPCALERITLVEANLGINKVNPYVNRSMRLRIDVDRDGALGATVAVTYKNSASGEGALGSGGTYLNYLRLFVPPDALVISTRLDGSDVPMKSGAEGDHMVTAVAFTVPPGETRTLEISYRRPMPGTTSKTLALIVRKQPGVGDTPLDVLIANGELVRYNTVLDQTKTFVVNVRK